MLRSVREESQAQDVLISLVHGRNGSTQGARPQRAHHGDRASSEVGSKGNSGIEIAARAHARRPQVGGLERCRPSNQSRKAPIGEHKRFRKAA